MTNDDVLGDEIPNDQQDAYRQFCFQILKLGAGVSLLNICLWCVRLVFRSFCDDKWQLSDVNKMFSVLLASLLVC